jgi:hypothetical protein
MRKIIPVPVQPGERYCFPCKRAQPVAAFPTRKGEPCSPCKPCGRKARNQRAVIDAILEAFFTAMSGWPSAGRAATSARLLTPVGLDPT